jgi:hypothetical protein
MCKKFLSPSLHSSWKNKKEKESCALPPRNYASASAYTANKVFETILDGQIANA